MVGPADRTDAGDKIDYTFVVTNTGNVTLTGVTISDPAFPSLSCSTATSRSGWDPELHRLDDPTQAHIELRLGHQHGDRRTAPRPGRHAGPDHGH